MLVLLPPSEGKADAPGGSAPLDLDSLVHPELSPQREKLIAKLAGLATISEKRALAAMGLSPNQTAELTRNADLLRAPAAPAADVYTGVLYQYLDLHSLSKSSRVRAAERILIASALWGVVRLEDRIPGYRLGMGAKLPRVKGLAAFWRPALAEALPADGLVVDMRSGGYIAAWKPADATHLGVNVFVEEAGKREIVTHMAKATRGDVARILVEAKRPASDPEGVADLVEKAGLRVELTATALNVILTERIGRLTKTKTTS
jgi:cytoplasmic iron level regulating protein YaaA (DUF328/UPF0246 family)